MNIGDSLERIREEEERIIDEELDVHSKQKALNDMQDNLDNIIDNGIWSPEKVISQQELINNRQVRLDKRREVLLKDRELLKQRQDRIDSQRGVKRSTFTRPTPEVSPSKRFKADNDMDAEVSKQKKKNTRCIST